jgi:pyruvate formate lyase activating enzyme
MTWRTFPHDPLPEQRCALCGRRSHLIAAHLGVCGACIRDRPDEARPLYEAAHARSRLEFGLAPLPPRTQEGVTCTLCAHHCRLGEEERGYCGLRVAHRGRLVHLAGTPARGVLHWYRDPLPTNCVAMDVCSGRGRHGYHNLAVFYGSCTLNCLFCQNWHFRDLLPTPAEVARAVCKGAGPPEGGISAADLAAAANDRTYCVCFFGGDPSSQMPHALAAARLLAERGVTICWETSGSANPRLMDRAVALSLATGGTVKFDLKAHHGGLHEALTGISNRATLANFARAARRITEQPDPPPLMASTLLVPGYVDAAEVGRIARFIAELDPNIPYALLGFAPHFFMPDLPHTSVHHAEEALSAAHAAGLTRVWIGNRALLSREY